MEASRPRVRRNAVTRGLTRVVKVWNGSYSKWEEMLTEGVEGPTEGAWIYVVSILPVVWFFFSRTQEQKERWSKGILLEESRFRILSHVLERINFGGGRKDNEVLNNESKTLELIEKELNIGRDCRENKELRVYWNWRTNTMEMGGCGQKWGFWNVQRSGSWKSLNLRSRNREARKHMKSVQDNNETWGGVAQGSRWWIDWVSSWAFEKDGRRCV